MGLGKKLDNLEEKLRARYRVSDLSTPENRRKARIHFDWFDHGILRRRWTNFFEIAPGVYRSNQPDHKRFEMMKKMGIHTVLNLRGVTESSYYLFEKESCDQLGLKLISTRLFARKAASHEELRDLISIFRDIERPLVIHCKSGADRAGLASAIWLMVMENRPVEDAQKMLSVKYVHLKFIKTGVLDYFLESYRAVSSSSN